MSTADNADLDPQLAALLQSLNDSGAPALQTLSPKEARASYLKGVQLLTRSAAEIGRSITTHIETSNGPLACRLYYPKGEKHESLAMVVYFHGGGWSFGDLDTHDNACRSLCASAQCLVASVDYSLAPEHKFPAAVNDAIAAGLWATENALVLGADPAKIVLAGDSAGANLATVTALALRDLGETDILCQLLLYPATDQSMSMPSHTTFGEGYRLTRPMMIWSSLNYLRDGRDILDPRASPLFAEDHSGLPPAIIVTAGFDPLRDEGAAYAEKLRESGVDTEYRCFEHLIHGFVNLTGAVDAAALAMDEIALMLKNRL